jgi:hypothetical protein
LGLLCDRNLVDMLLMLVLLMLDLVVLVLELLDGVIINIGSGTGDSTM